jgi:hypothetical protein
MALGAYIPAGDRIGDPVRNNVTLSKITIAGVPQILHVPLKAKHHLQLVKARTFLILSIC